MSRYERGGEIRRAKASGSTPGQPGLLKFLIRYPSQRRGLSPAQIIEKTLDAVAESSVSTWGLFDHDGRPDIDRVCVRGNQQGVNVALSHPAFELCLLLHFPDFSVAQGGSNSVILERLRAAHPAFVNYREGSKRIDARRFEALCADDGIRKASSRARRMSANFTYQTPNHRDPSTNVYLLIEQLGIAHPPR